MSNYDTIHINMTLLKQNQTIFEQKEKDFHNRTYSTFKSSYLNNSSDIYVRQMSNELNILYNKISKGYALINKWWSNYNDSVLNNEELLKLQCDMSIDTKTFFSFKVKYIF